MLPKTFQVLRACIFLAKDGYEMILPKMLQVTVCRKSRLPILSPLQDYLISWSPNMHLYLKVCVSVCNLTLFSFDFTCSYKSVLCVSQIIPKLTILVRLTLKVILFLLQKLFQLWNFCSLKGLVYYLFFVKYHLSFFSAADASCM